MWVPIEKYFCSLMDFRTQWSRRKKEWKEQRTLGGKGRKERKKESCTVGPGEWALSDVVLE